MHGVLALSGKPSKQNSTLADFIAEFELMSSFVASGNEDYCATAITHDNILYHA
jgi:hypothetical protein